MYCFCNLKNQNEENMSYYWNILFSEIENKYVLFFTWNLSSNISVFNVGYLYFPDGAVLLYRCT